MRIIAKIYNWLCALMRPDYKRERQIAVQRDSKLKGLHTGGQ
jgi:hypothetical protein